MNPNELVTSSVQVAHQVDNGMTNGSHQEFEVRRHLQMCSILYNALVGQNKHQQSLQKNGDMNRAQNRNVKKPQSHQHQTNHNQFSSVTCNRMQLSRPDHKKIKTE